MERSCFFMLLRIILTMKKRKKEKKEKESAALGFKYKFKGDSGKPDRGAVFPPPRPGSR